MIVSLKLRLILYTIYLSSFFDKNLDGRPLWAAFLLFVVTLH